MEIMMSAVTQSAIWREYVQGKTNLDLGSMNLGDESIIALAEILKEDTTIRSIDLSNNKITVVGANALADALRVNDYIATNPFGDTNALNFSGNDFGKEGIFAIIKAFDETNRFVHCLVLEDENITDEDVEELIRTPEMIRIRTRSDEFQKQLHPSGDCIIL
jgi:hypothetical protein